VVNFDFETHLGHRSTHRGTDIVQGVHGRNGEVPAFDAGAVTDVATVKAVVGCPGSLFGVDGVAGAGDVSVPLHVVKHEEFGFGAEEGRVPDARGREVFLGALGDGAGIALVALHGGGLHDVAAHDNRGVIGEGVDDRRAVIRHEDHVGLVDAFPASDGRAIEHFAILEEIFVDFAHGEGYVLLLTTAIGEAQVHPFHIIFFNQLEGLFRHCRASS